MLITLHLYFVYDLYVTPFFDNMPLYPFFLHLFQAMNKLVTKSCEDTRQSIRRARQKVWCAFSFS